MFRSFLALPAIDVTDQDTELSVMKLGKPIRSDHDYRERTVRECEVRDFLDKWKICESMFKLCSKFSRK